MITAAGSGSQWSVLPWLSREAERITALDGIGAAIAWANTPEQQAPLAQALDTRAERLAK
jgi:hypothetical protein